MDNTRVARHEIQMILGNVAALSEPAVPKFVPRRFDVDEGSSSLFGSTVLRHGGAGKGKATEASDRHKLLHEPFCVVNGVADGSARDL